MTDFSIDNHINLNVCILLSAGYSNRFGQKVPKQLYRLETEQKSIIELSLDTLKNVTDKIIIITNDICYVEIEKIVKKYDNVTILINNENSRIKSIFIGLQYIIKMDNVSNIIIHDSARPFVSKEYYINMLKISDIYGYSQYYMKLTNGLAKISSHKEITYEEITHEEITCDVIDRNEYIELCTPILITKNLLLQLNLTEPVNEFIDILNKNNISYKLIEGTNKYLKKITTIDDV